jgi:hypothetical protein
MDKIFGSIINSRYVTANTADTEAGINKIQHEGWIDKLQKLMLGSAMASTALLSFAPTALAQSSSQETQTRTLVEDLASVGTEAVGTEAVGSTEAASASDIPLFDTIAQQSASQYAQEESSDDEPSGPLQADISPADRQAMEELISIAVRNAPAVRDANAAMGLTPFVDALVLEIAPSRLSSTLSDASDPALAEPYLYSDNSTTTTFTFNPIRLISGIQQMPALRSHLRDAEQQTRVAVIQNYVAYVQARQSASVASRQLNTVVASILETSQVASAQLTQIPASSVLANNEDYVAAATESLAANSDEMVALETLAAAVGMPTAEMLTVIETSLIQAVTDQPVVAVEQPSEAQPAPAMLVINKDKD